VSTIRMPQLGESVVEGTIGKWLVQEGQRVEKDQPVVEILTDKADSEINALDAGVVTKIHAQEGAVVAVGDALCDVDASAQAVTASAPPKAAAKKSAPPPAVPAPAAPELRAAPSSESSSRDASGSPAIRKLAREQGVDLTTVVSGSGNGGRLTKDDVLRAARVTPLDSSVPPPPRPAAAPPAAPRPAESSNAVSIASGAFRVPPYTPRPGDQEVPFSRRRRIIADHMVYSKLTSPHVVTVAEVDVQKTETLRKSTKDALKKEGVNLKFLAFVAAATARALRENKALNARVLTDSYVLLGEINLGIAVDTPEGLVVPVIRNAADLTVRGLAKAIDEMAVKARDGKLTPDDLAAKTFTISNPGR
jgi:2-oxoglutarate dehydrogenase E2 component (dihydrolipoamide succinyltransferase)